MYSVYWLGICICPEGTCSNCGLQVDPFGDHHLSCLGSGDKILRHNSLHNVLFSAARLAALSPQLEAPLLIPTSNSRPADVYLPTWNHGSPAALAWYNSYLSTTAFYTTPSSCHPGTCLDGGPWSESSSTCVCMSASWNSLHPLACWNLRGMVFLSCLHYPGHWASSGCSTWHSATHRDSSLVPASFHLSLARQRCHVDQLLLPCAPFITWYWIIVIICSLFNHLVYFSNHIHSLFISHPINIISLHILCLLYHSIPPLITSYCFVHHFNLFLCIYHLFIIKS